MAGQRIAQQQIKATRAEMQRIHAKIMKTLLRYLELAELVESTDHPAQTAESPFIKREHERIYAELRALSAKYDGTWRIVKEIGLTGAFADDGKSPDGEG